MFVCWSSGADHVSSYKNKITKFSGKFISGRRINMKVETNSKKEKIYDNSNNIIMTDKTDLNKSVEY